MNKKKIILPIICFLLLLTSKYVYSEDMLFYKEVNLIGGYSEIDHWIWEGQTQRNSVGCELFKKFSNEYGDFLTADIQMRLAYDTKESFDSGWSVEIHNAWLEYKLGLGKEIRAGHFTPAFGLETVVDTHGTLFQTLIMKDIGFKKDWGIEYRGAIKSFDFLFAGQIGSGMGIERKDDSYLFTSRIGRPQTEEFQYGLSFLYGNVLVPLEMRTFPRPDYLANAVNKKRVGVDAQYDLAPFIFRGELAFGENDGEKVIGVLLESIYKVPKIQELDFTLQGQMWDNDIDESNTNDSFLGVGFSYEINSNLSVRAAYFYDLEIYGSEKDRKVLVQLYYFGL